MKIILGIFLGSFVFFSLGKSSFAGDSTSVEEIDVNYTPPSYTSRSGEADTAKTANNANTANIANSATYSNSAGSASYASRAREAETVSGLSCSMVKDAICKEYGSQN